MNLVRHIKQEKMLFLLIYAISYVIFSSNLLAHEISPTDFSAKEAGITPSGITPKESEKRLQDAMLLFDRGKTDAAIYMLQQLEKDDPTNYKVLFKLGEMAIGAKNWAYAILVLRKASFIRPKDTEIRLVLMDIYKAYEMPIQEIILGREILALDPENKPAMKKLSELGKKQSLLEEEMEVRRKNKNMTPAQITASFKLAQLYKEQNLTDDEVKIRKNIKRIVPEDYENLKRLAAIYYGNGELWEAAKIYEQIRKYHPEKTGDMTLLADNYGKLGNSFRGLQILDQIEKNGASRKWLKGQAIKNFRLENSVKRPFSAGTTFRNDNMEEMDVFFNSTTVNYTHVRIPLSIDVGVEAKFTSIHHSGRKTLDGRMDIYSGTLVGKAIKSWKDQDYTFEAKLGILWDDVHGRLKPSVQNPGLTSKDFPFLKHPSFDSYGGVMPVWGLKFKAQPGLHSTYQFAYERGQVEGLDARLRMFYFDKTTQRYSYNADNSAELLLQAEELSISDGNSRFHGLASFHYILWGSFPMHNYRTRFHLPFFRKRFLRGLPLHYVRAGYTFEFSDDTKSTSVNYEVLNRESKHKYEIEARARIYNRGGNDNVFLNFVFDYSDGSTLDFQRHVGVKLSSSNKENEFGLSFDFVEQSATNTSANARISGKSRSSEVYAYIQWQF